MQPHRIDPAVEAPVVPASAPALRSVAGLGLTDVLRVELLPCQIDAFLAEVDELYGPLVESFESARARHEALPRRTDGAPSAPYDEADEELSRAAYALRLLPAIRGQLPLEPPSEPVTIVGPAGMISTLIAGAAAHVTSSLAEQVASKAQLDERGGEELRRLATAAEAWVGTYLDCREVEWFRFDPNWDPGHPE